ncbi:hypothetical protein C8R47DRAFT_1226876 [Mycena vitilis]|nr:hypothetical protein C8R47DRAFT_1226876 [Mycena vitilis]
MPHPQSASLSAQSPVPPFASHSTATNWQSSVGENGNGTENASATEYAAIGDGNERHATITAFCDGIGWPDWDIETLMFFAMHPVSAYPTGEAVDASLDLLDHIHSDLLLSLVPAPPCADYDNFIATALTFPPLEPPFSHTPPANAIAREEATYEPNIYDEGMGDIAAEASTFHALPAVPPTGLDTASDELTWLPVSTPQQVAPSAPAEQAPHHAVVTSEPQYIPYGPYPALPPSYFASQLVPVAPSQWHGAQHSVAGQSHIQSYPHQHESPNLNILLPSYPMSAATSPSTTCASLPPTPGIWPSVPPASRPVRKPRTRSRATPRTAAAAVPVRRRSGRCRAVAQFSEDKIQQTVAAAKATLYATTPTVRCDWAGCTNIVNIKDIFKHLKDMHGLKGSAVRSLCRWGNGKCSENLRGDDMRKHVTRSTHLNLKLICVSCDKTFEGGESLKRHLRGAPLKA